MSCSFVQKNLLQLPTYSVLTTHIDFSCLYSCVHSGWRIPCRRRLLLRPASGNLPKRRQWLQLSITNLQCLTPITLSFSFSLYPSCSLSFSLSLITILHPPSGEMVAGISLSLNHKLRRAHFSPFLSSLSHFATPCLTFSIFSLHFLSLTYI